MAKSKVDGKTISQNKKAFHDYFVVETIEAGIELCGTEVKSIRQGAVNLKDSWCDIKNGEVFVKRFPGLAEEELYPFEDTPAYPDCSCNFECYTNGEMLESESLSPLMPIKTGEVVEHEEEWEIFVANEPTTEEELSAFFDANVL